MAVLDDFKGASILCKVAFILLLIASMFTCISYKTTSWGYEANNPFLTNTNHMGLWRMCGDGDKPEGCETIDGWANGKGLLSLIENVYIMTIIAGFLSLSILHILLPHSYFHVMGKQAIEISTIPVLSTIISSVCVFVCLFVCFFTF